MDQEIKDKLRQQAINNDITKAPLLIALARIVAEMIDEDVLEDADSKFSVESEIVIYTKARTVLALEQLLTEITK